MNKSRSGWIALVLAGALGLGIGCGGSGGGGDDGSDGGTTGFTAANLEKAGGVGNETLSTAHSLTAFSQTVLREWYMGTAGKTVARTAAQEVPGACASGTMDVTFTDEDESGDLTAGDTLVFQFTACQMTVENETLRFDGTITVTAGVVDGWPGDSYSLELGFSFSSGFTVNSDGGSAVLSGGFTYSESSESAGLSYQMGIRGERLELVETDDSGTYTTRLTDFSFTFTIATVDEAYSAEADGTVYDSDLGATVAFDTTTPFTGTGDENPSAGVMVMAADDGSRVTLTVLDDTRVELALDADGDGTPEQTVEVLWDDL